MSQLSPNDTPGCSPLYALNSSTVSSAPTPLEKPLLPSGGATTAFALVSLAPRSQVKGSERYYTLIYALNSLRHQPEQIWNPDDLKPAQVFRPKDSQGDLR
jgi:hypothetical protein